MSFFARQLSISTIFCLFLFCFVRLISCQLYSPCPNVFQYRQDQYGNLFGYIEVPTPNSSTNKVRLDVQFSVGNAVHGSNGHIELTAGRLNTLDDVLNRRRIRYNINFPYWRNIPPRITQIAVNHRVLCTGPPIPRHLVDILTTVNLQHTLTLTVPLGNDFYDIQGPFDLDNDVNIPNIGNPTDPFSVDNHFGGRPTTSEEKFDVTTTPSPPPTRRPSRPSRPDNVCGVSLNTNSLILGGNRFQKGAHPWLAALFAQKREGIDFTCGTTLVSKRHAITAAHCIHTKRKRYRADELWVVLGRENIQRWSNDGAQIIQAETVHVHPDFKFTTADGDIAIIVLGEEVVFSTLIRPACLWSGDSDIRTIVNEVGVVVGWGRDESGVTTPEPKQMSFPVVSGEECLRSNAGFWEITSNRTFCAGYRNNSGPCNGDSGGGFLMQINGRWTLRGVVSTSLATAERVCDLTQYVVFSDVTQYTEWMLPILSN